MECINNKRNSSFQKIVHRLRVCHICVAQWKPYRILFSHTSQTSFTKEMGTPVSTLWMWEVAYKEVNQRAFHCQKMNWKGRSGKELSRAGSTWPVQSLPCLHEICVVFCLFLIWPTSSHYFPVNSCLSSTLVLWDGDSHGCSHMCIRRVNVKSQYSRRILTTVFTLENQLFQEVPVATAHKGCKSAK